MRSGRGRKPKPVELKILQGNPGKRPIPNDIPQPEKLYTAPEAPAWLDDYAKEIWNDLALKLTKAGILSELDINVLAYYCSAASICIMARKRIEDKTLIMTFKNEDGTLKHAQKSPFITVYREALDDVIRLGAQLGLSPSERVRLRGIGKKETDEFDEFLKTGKAAK